MVPAPAIYRLFISRNIFNLVDQAFWGNSPPGHNLFIKRCRLYFFE
jgi:hypothetical protein